MIRLISTGGATYCTRFALNLLPMVSECGRHFLVVLGLIDDLHYLNRVCMRRTKNPVASDSRPKAINKAEPKPRVGFHWSCYHPTEPRLPRGYITSAYLLAYCAHSFPPAPCLLLQDSRCFSQGLLLPMLPSLLLLLPLLLLFLLLPGAAHSSPLLPAASRRSVLRRGWRQTHMSLSSTFPRFFSSGVPGSPTRATRSRFQAQRNSIVSSR